MTFQNSPGVETLVETLDDGSKRTTFRKVIQPMKEHKRKHKHGHTKEPVDWRDSQFWKERLSGLKPADAGASTAGKGYQKSWDDSDWGYGDPYGGTGYKYDNKAVGRIEVVNSDGKVVASKDTWSQSWLTDALAVYPNSDPKVVRVPVEHVKKLTEGTVTFNACTFTAAEDYLHSLFGRLLHRSDREWLALHPFATDDGIAVEYMASAIHELVGVYGFGVSRVRLRAGMLAAGVDHKKWARALGCNPFGLVDHRTPNAVAAEQMGLSLEQANQLFRFEYHEDPFAGSIVGEKGWTSTKAGGGVGAEGGHARYVAPRDYAGNWQISLLLQPLSELSYAQEIVPTKYERRKGIITFNTDDVLRPDGKPIQVWNQPKSTGSTTPEKSQGNLFPTAGTIAKAPLRKEDGYCVKCKAPVELEEMLDPETMALCTMCIEDLWEGFTCPGCKVDLPDTPPFLTNEDAMEFTCARCSTEMLPPNDEVALCFRAAIAAVVGPV